MKKFLCLMAFALVFTLTGCKDAVTSLTDGNEALITIGKTEITKDEIYTSLKSKNGVTVILSKLTNFIIDKEVPITDEIKKEAQEHIDSFISYIGKDTMEIYVESMGYESIEAYRDNAVTTNVRAEKITDKYVDEHFEELSKKYQLRKVQILQTADSKVASEIQLAIKEGTLTFEDALVQYKDKLTTSTFTGKEQIISNTTTLDSSILKNIFEVKEDNTLLSTYQFNDQINKFYIVKVVDLEVSLEDGKDTLLGISTIGDEAFANYLKKYGFVVYDIDLYNGIYANAPTYLIQDNK